jgi:outer membrane cobalamin receptor
MGTPYYNVVAVFKDGKYNYNSDTCGVNVDFHSQNNILVGLALESDSYKQNGSLSCYKLNKSRKNCATYMQFNFSVNKFTLIPAIRYDNNSQFGYIFTPSLKHSI